MSVETGACLVRLLGDSCRVVMRLGGGEDFGATPDVVGDAIGIAFVFFAVCSISELSG